MINSIGPQRGMPRVLRCVWVSISLFTCSVVFAPNPNTLIRNIVLVHSAWADAAGWQGVWRSRHPLIPSDLSKSGAIKKMPDDFTYLDPAQFHDWSAADLSEEAARHPH